MALLEIHDQKYGRQILELTDQPVTLGRRAPHAAYVIEGDGSISRLHAKVAPFGNGLGWSVEDQGSTNGTFVNGEQIYALHKLANGDEIRVGGTLIVFRQADADAGSSTQQKKPAPKVTDRERDVLKELCRPYYGKELTKGASSRKEIAERLFVGEAAVQAHLGHLYDRFGIPDEPNRRNLLAEHAIQNGVIGRRDYEDDGDTRDG
jgi:DNA-binding CsgD family transcriptional regulator